jgi:hypothetical protein
MKLLKQKMFARRLYYLSSLFAAKHGRKRDMVTYTLIYFGIWIIVDKNHERGIFFF